jgi:hypothetical protein
MPSTAAAAAADFILILCSAVLERRRLSLSRASQYDIRKLDFLF